MNDKQEMKRLIQQDYGVAVSTAEIDRRLQETYASLGEMPKGKRKLGKRILTWSLSAAGGVAAAFVLLLGIGLASPAFAAQVPGVGNIVKLIKEGWSGYHQSPVLTDGGTEAYLQPLNARQGGFAVTGVYCDGLTMVLTTELTLAKTPQEVRVAEAQMTVEVNGTTLLAREQNWLNKMERSDDTHFIGTLYFSVSHLQLNEQAEVSVRMENAVGKDTKLLVLGQDGQYREKEYPLEIPDAALTFAAKVDGGLAKSYEVGQEQQGYRLDRVTITPGLTRLEGSAMDREKGMVQLLHDNLGNPVPRLEKYSGNSDESLDGQYFYPVAKGATSITLLLYSPDDKETPVAEFTVPIEKAYGEAFDKDRLQKRDDTPVVYDPPLKAEDERYNYRLQDPYAKVLELGETVETSESMETGKLAVTIDNMRVYKNFQAAGISAADMNILGTESEMQARIENPENRFVLFDITLESRGTNHAGDDDKGILSYARPGEIYVSEGGRETGLYVPTEIEYFSGHGKGWKDYYMFSLADKETKTYEVGYIVPVAALKEGNFQLIVSQIGGIPYNWEEVREKEKACIGTFINIPPWNGKES